MRDREANRFKVLALDFDGVLTPRIGVDWPRVKKEASKLVGMEIASLLEFYRSYSGTEAFKKVSNFVKKYEVEAASKAELTPCMDELLEKAAMKGVKIYVATLQAREPIQIFLRRYGLEKYVTKIVCREDFADKRSMLAFILKDAGVSPREAIFVDDMYRNIKQCMELGLVCIRAERDKRKMVETVAKLLGLHIKCLESFGH